jgi:prolyl 4-hydroxylase
MNVKEHMQRLSELEDGKMKSDRQVKEIIANRKTESCVREYDRVVSKEWCNKVIDLFEQSKTNTFDDERKSFTELDIECKEEFKDIKETYIRVLKQNLQHFMKEVNIEKHHLPPLIDMENIRIKKYVANDKDVFKDHVDVLRSQGPSAKRFLVFIMYLSDVEEGGETSIPRYKIKCKPKAGKLLMFPPFWTHPHQGEKVIKGTKYQIMTYLHYGDINDNNIR